MASDCGIVCGSVCGVGHRVSGCSFIIGTTTGSSMWWGKVKVRWGTVVKWVDRQIKGELWC